MSPILDSPPARAVGEPAAPRDAWAIRAARVSGIPIRIHFTFLLFVTWFALSGIIGRSALMVVSLLALFLCIILHELGHSLVAQRFGYRVRDITLYPVGGVAAIEGSPTPRHELAIALAGPAVNVVIAAVLAVVLGARHALPQWTWPPWNSPENAVLLQTSPLAFLLIANASVVAFNMLPAFPMDGGRVLRALLGLVIGKPRATRIAAAIGQLLAVLMGIYGAGVFGAPANYGLCIIALFVYFGAGQERRVEETTEVFAGATVGDAMVRDFASLAAGDSLQRAVDLLLSSSQQDFPVLTGDSVEGVLSRSQLLRALAADGPGGAVGGVLGREVVFAAPEDDVEDYLLRPDGVQRAPVLVRDAAGALVGMLTLENLMEYMTVRQIAERREAGG